MILPDTEMFLYRHPVDMRKQVNGLVSIVSGEMQLDPTSSALFVFIGKSGDKLKILQYETNGFWLWYRILQRQKFKWPKQWFEDEVLTLSRDSMQFLLQGCDLNGLKQFVPFKPKRAC